MTTAPATADIGMIKRLIPHRYPFLLIDRVEEIVGTDRGVGIKNVTMNEPHFQGHFPEEPVMPGVLVIEAMAQTAAVVVCVGLDLLDKGSMVYFMSVESAKFRNKVVPGDRLELHCETLRGGGRVWKFRGVGKVDGKVVCEAVYTAMLVIPDAT